jgi:uncharacterized protein (TIGR02231 family)
MTGKELAVCDLAAPVAAVTVLEDRAQVTRRGAARLEAGRALLRISGVAPVLADRTLTVKVEGADGAVTVTDARVRRELRGAAAVGDGSVQGRLLELAAQKTAALETLALESDDVRLLDQAAVAALDDATGDAAWGRGAADQWRVWLSELAARERRARDRILELREQIETVDEAIRDLKAQLADAPPRVLDAAIDLELEAARDAEVTVEVSYVVPGACWRPQHTARLQTADTSVRVAFSTEACVWQRTGEDWHEALLRFSTQRPSLGARPPLLDDDTLVARERPEKLAVETRDQEIRTTGLGAAGRPARELPGIDDGGAVLAFQAPHPASVPSDGRPYRVALGAFGAAAEEALVLMPERAAAVLRRATFANEGATPILAGPVDLIADGGLVGRTVARFTAPGERVAMGFGPDPAIRVQRRADRVDRSAGLLAGRVRTEHTVTLLLSSIGTETRSFDVTERIPVSEVEQVKITFDREATVPPAVPDADGHLTWHVTLPPGGNRTMKLRYTLERPKDVE